MMKHVLHLFVLLIACILSCSHIQSGKYIRPDGTTISSRFVVPAGFTRTTPAAGSFAHYLRQLPLKPHGTAVKYYDGRIKSNTSAYCAVVDIDVGNKDLQQCADAVMRLRAEYLFKAGKQQQIQFHFTNGFLAQFSKWLQGYRIQVKGNQVQWVKIHSPTPPAQQYQELKKYLQVVFTYAGTLSLAKELVRVPSNKDLQSGDVFIMGGSPGHAVIVVDVATNKSGEKICLLAQSYMPAQDIQVLVNPENSNLSPWYTVSDTHSNLLTTPEWTFEWKHLKRFQQ